MIDIETWFLLSISVTLFWGLSGIFAKYSSPRLGVARIALIIAVVEGSFYTVGFLLLRDSTEVTLYEGVVATLSCMVGISGYLFYFESIMDGQVAIAGTISAAFPVLTVIGAVALLSESLTGTQVLGVAVIIVGILTISYEPDPNAVNAVSKRSLMFAALAFFAWGAWSLSSKVAVDMVGPGNMLGFYIISSLTAPLIYSWIRHIRPADKLTDAPTRRAWSIGCVALALNVVGAFAYTFALEDGAASLVVPISSAYPIVTVLLAIAVLKERLNWVQAVSVVAIATGLVVIGLSA
ncbi:MAG TPA: DMT family transporter [Thermoplasmata archaeon]|nr:DMT family transporter [Thermoplasmata archaeon]